MDVRDLERRRKEWELFKQWERKEPAPAESPQELLKTVSEWVAFYLKRHPRPSDAPPDISGIQSLHKRLALLKRFQ